MPNANGTKAAVTSTEPIATPGRDLFDDLRIRSLTACREYRASRKRKVAGQ